MSQIQLTNAGAALVAAATGPIILDSFQLGSGVNYTPEPTDIALHGVEVFSGTPSAPFVINANIYKWSIFVDYPIGPFEFGEFGFYVGTTLFALGSLAELVQKIPLTSVNPGNSIRIDAYISVVGNNFAMWVDLNQSNNQFRLGILQNPDFLPISAGAVPNAFIIQGVDNTHSAYLAYTDTSGLWNFDAYAYALQAPATVTASDSLSISFDISQFQPGMVPAFFGQVILQFSTGALFSVCRYVKAAVVGPTSVTLSFQTPLALLPQVGDSVVIQSRQILSTQVQNLPPATATVLGAIIVGTTLTVTSTGLLNINPTAIPVKSVNGQTGNVELTASDIIDIAEVAVTGQYTDILNTPIPFELKPATTLALGGVKAPSVSEGHLIIASDGTIDLAFNPVKTVNGEAPNIITGDVEIAIPNPTGLINPTVLGASTNLNGVVATGLYFILVASIPSIINLPPSVTTEGTLEVVPFSVVGGTDVIQRFTTATQMFFRGLTGATWSAWSELQPVQQHIEQTVLATSIGQTTFVTTGYPIGFIEAFIAGIRMTPNIDFTATDGVNVTIINTSLAAQIQIGTPVTVSSYSLFTVANAVEATQLAASTGATLVGFNGTTVGASLTTVESEIATLQAEVLPTIISVNYKQPLTGFSIQMANTDTHLIIDPAGTLATGTVLLPTAPVDKQKVKITSSWTITALTLSPGGAQTVVSAPTTFTTSTGSGAIGIEYIYRAANTTWYRL